ncbi:MAG: trypsin-like peptidase domain-containing protein [Acidobacteria bacterium]|nr:trypsin-like peptidase domain-containing protein [Acidobacteriota bacterium]
MPEVAVGRVLDRLSDELAELTARVLRATVAISGPTPDGGSSGSGFFIDTRGHIVTNHHVVAGMEPPVSVTMQGGSTALAGIVGVDLISDLAVLKLDGTWKHTLPLRRSAARAGELCLAAGNPLGRYPETVTIGVVSGLARTAVAGPGRPHYHLLQTDCGIHEGNSGGPLVDVRGRVIGVTTLIDAESDDIGLAIPVETVRDVVPDLMNHGCVIRATIGVSIRGRTREVGGEPVRGLEVVRLTRERGQALKVGDFILRVGGTPMPDPPALFGVLNADCIGRSTVVDLVRQGRLQAVTVKPWRLQL